MSGKHRAEIYHLKVEGHLDAGWNVWFPALVVTAQADGTTDLCGPIEDQTLLHSVLARLRDLNVGLLGVERSKGRRARYCRACRNSSNLPGSFGGGGGDTGAGQHD